MLMYKNLVYIVPISALKKALLMVSNVTYVGYVDELS